MRFLHTGDWHIGKMLKGRNRRDEHAAVLTEIVDIARRERVDALLLGGDSFDSYAPEADAERLVYATLAECCGAGIPVVVIGGNHDHPRRLAALRQLLDTLKIYVRAEPCRPDAGGVIRLPARDGREVAHIRCFRSCRSRGSSTPADSSTPKSSGTRRTPTGWPR